MTPLPHLISEQENILEPKIIELKIHILLVETISFSNRCLLLESCSVSFEVYSDYICDDFILSSSISNIHQEA